MNYFDFIRALEGIAIDKGLRLMMNRAPVGSGVHFYFIDDTNQSHSRAVTWNKNHEEPIVLFARLEELADEFTKGRE